VLRSKAAEGEKSVTGFLECAACKVKSEGGPGERGPLAGPELAGERRLESRCVLGGVGGGEVFRGAGRQATEAEREFEFCGGAYSGLGAAGAEDVVLRPVLFAEWTSCGGDVKVVACGGDNLVLTMPAKVPEGATGASAVEETRLVEVPVEGSVLGGGMRPDGVAERMAREVSMWVALRGFYVGRVGLQAGMAKVDRRLPRVGSCCLSDQSWLE